MCWMIWGHEEANGLILGRWLASQSPLVIVTVMTICCLDSPPSLFPWKQHLDFLLGNFLSPTPSPFGSVGSDLTPSCRWELVAPCLATPAERGVSIKALRGLDWCLQITCPSTPPSLWEGGQGTLIGRTWVTCHLPDEGEGWITVVFFF